MKPRKFFGMVLIALGILAACNLAVARLASRTPLHTLKNRIGQMPRIDFLFCGDSTMDSGCNATAFETAWQAATGRKERAFNSALRATRVVEHYLTMREAFRQHPEINTVVYGFWNFQLTQPLSARWRDLSGNSTLVYHYEPALAASLYDSSFFTKAHFSLMRFVPMFSERATIWVKVEILRRALSALGMPPVSRQEEAFPVYSKEAVAEAVASFTRDCEQALRDNAPLWRPVREFIRHAHERGSKAVFVSMPMSSWNYRLFYSTDAWQRYSKHVQSLLEKEGAIFVETSDWFTDDQNFADVRHLNPDAAKVFSERLAGVLARAPRPSQPSR
jgi:hypothetical protein